jgi:hypothetical protein
MRSQFELSLPASYLSLQEAYALKQKIEEQDKARESYFSQFNPKIFKEKWNEESFQNEVKEEISQVNFLVTNRITNKIVNQEWSQRSKNK